MVSHSEFRIPRSEFPLTASRLVLRNLVHHRRIHGAVALGVAAAVAVLTGALLVGDSMRGSLRHLALDRLGRYDEALVTDRFFRGQLAAELVASTGFDEHFAAAVPAIMVTGTAESHFDSSTRSRPDEPTGRAGSVTVLGCPSEFWHGGDGDVGPSPQLAAGEVVLNAELAGPDQLNVRIGDEVLLVVGRRSQIPSDSPLGHKGKDETTRSLRLKVGAIIPSTGLGRFGLSPSQLTPRLAFVDTRTLQDLLEQPRRANAILLAGKLGAAAVSTNRWLAESKAASSWLTANLRPRLADYGLSIKHVIVGDPSHPASDYYSLSSNRMLLEGPAEEAARRAWNDLAVQPVLSYLANDLEAHGRHVPYSIITAVDSQAGLGPHFSSDGKPIGPLADDEIVLIDWAANDLKIQVGAKIRVTYFEPDTLHGEPRERTDTLRLRAIVPLAAPGQPPFATNDPDLTPALPGVTDRKSIANWKLPFDVHTERIRPRDDQFWTDHRTTPKAYVSLARGRRMWASRFGQTTSLRLAPANGVSEDSLAQRLRDAIKPAQLGFAFQPVKRISLEASAGATPFDVLFLMFSSFLIAAALMLLAILFRLGIDLRAGEIGLLLAVGLSRRRVTGLMAAEGMLVAALGGLLGMAGGIGYAWLLMAGLRTWWISAVSTPLLQLHVTTESLAIGYICGVLCCGLTIALALFQLRRVPTRQLLAGNTTPTLELPVARGAGRGRWIAAAMLLLAVALAPLAARLDGEARSGAFFTSGSLVLAAALTGIWSALRRPGGSRLGGRDPGRELGLMWLARRNAARNPARSTLTIGLTAAAAFLIVASSAFRRDVSDIGSGGFDLLSNSSVPIYQDLETAAGLREPSEETGDLRDQQQLSRCSVAAFRVADGEDASCLNLYRQQRQPRILGVPATLASLCAAPHHFAWSAVAPGADRPTDTGDDAPWRLLEQTLPPGPHGQPRVPVVLDETTATYGLKPSCGLGDTIPAHDGRGQAVSLVVVGLLANSIFQGDLLIDERQFLALFPDTSGYRYFLVRSPPGKSAVVRAILRQRLGDYGFDVAYSHQRLAELTAVENTYLSTFQTLGALGLLLGTFGLAAVQLRAVLERRGEMALLRAAGFRRRSLAMLVLYENSLLLVGGVGAGVAAALVAVAPHLVGSGARLPWGSLLLALGLVLAVGLSAGLVAARATLRAPLLAALRGE